MTVLQDWVKRTVRVLDLVIICEGRKIGDKEYVIVEFKGARFVVFPEDRSVRVTVVMEEG